MIVVAGETRLSGAVVRELLGRKVDVDGASFDDLPMSGPPLTAVIAEGTRDARELLERAASTVAVRGGTIVFATARRDDDPVVVALKRRGMPYTIVRASGLVDLPEGMPSSFVLVPSDLGRAPFSTVDHLARAVADEVASGRIGTGATVDVTEQVGPRAWASALRSAGARAYVVPRWLARLASLFGIFRLEVSGRDVRLTSAWAPRRRPRMLPARAR